MMGCMSGLIFELLQCIPESIFSVITTSDEKTFWPREAGSMFSVNKQGFCVESLWHRKHASVYSGHNHFHGLVRRWKPKHHAGWHKIIPLQAHCHPLNTQETAQILQEGIQAEALLMCQAPRFVLINSSWQHVTNSMKCILKLVT